MESAPHLDKQVRIWYSISICRIAFARPTDEEFDILEVSAVSIIADRVARTPARAGTAVTNKPFLPTTRRDKVIVGLVLFFVLVLTFASFGTEKINYPKVGGGSMEPTIHQPIYVPFGDPSVRHRGAYVHINMELEPSLGSIVMFRHSKDRDVKRVKKIRSDGALLVTADNVGVTGADSREYGWIARSDIVGVVDRIITPRRIIRALTENGRWWNWVEFNYSPSSVQPLGSDGRYVAITRDGDVSLYHSPSQIPVRTLRGKFVGWDNDRIVVVTLGDNPSQLTSDLQGRVSRVEPKPPVCVGLACASGAEPGSTLVFDGVAGVNRGDMISFPNRPGIKTVNVREVRYMVCGGPGGIATIAYLKTPLTEMVPATELVTVSR